MVQAPQVEPISNFRRAHIAVMEKLKNGPVFLAQRGTLAVALVSIEEWDRIAKELAHYKHLALLEERSKQVRGGDYLIQEQVEQGLRERGLIE